MQTPSGIYRIYCLLVLPGGSWTPEFTSSIRCHSRQTAVQRALSKSIIDEGWLIQLCQTVPCPSFFRRHFADTYVITNLSSFLSSTHHALTGNVDKLIRNDFLHIKCKLFTHLLLIKSNRLSPPQFVLQTLPLTWPFVYDVTEVNCHIICVVRQRAVHLKQGFLTVGMYERN